MALNLKIKTKIVKNTPVLDLEGEIDVYTYPGLNESMLNLIKAGHANIVINLEKVTYIDSTGLGVLANSTNKLSEKEGQLRIVCNNPQLIKIFSVSGLTNKNLRIFPTEALAFETKVVAVKVAAAKPKAKKKIVKKAKPKAKKKKK